MSLQGTSENILTSSDKILASKRKIQYKNHVAKGNIKMFPLLMELMGEQGYQITGISDNCKSH